jgi:hypothetical protein
VPARFLKCKHEEQRPQAEPSSGVGSEQVGRSVSGMVTRQRREQNRRGDESDRRDQPRPDAREPRRGAP